MDADGENESRPKTDDTTCAICEKKLSSLQNLRNHIRLHSDGEKEYKCHICDKSYVLKRRLERHMAVHTGLEHLCPTCGKCLQTDHSLKRHIDTIHCNKGPYVCETCGKAFSSKGHLKGHQSAKHGKEKCFKCDACHKTFSYEKNLKHHISEVCGRVKRISTLYQCDVCQKAFKAKRYLKQHKVVHDKGKIVCYVCGRNFRWRSSYKAHKKTCHL